ncbi:hypothetical protein AZF37_00970 [endosymbiont 'TC1' of Trimyema compressum]|uniref:WxL domain-containing protein n=1 Tax=endosymbiont 'TC1' of Trimyema compressum TaxID=243899 RepID=UPI0007F124FD|nr:WxL domain-containing protein [endosymbiont 'TC1' of Trimyema compressum]AMP19940.1 hypothetical protein AZF37_00970 [endosymbiont 'TC1' of Trimyema compressum]
MKKKISVLLLGLIFGLALPTSVLFADTVVSTTTTTASATFSLGTLTMNYVPANFTFGTLPVAISTVTATLGAEDSYDLGVTDSRGGTNGYNVTVKAGKMKSMDAQHTLGGNNIKLINGSTQLVTPGSVEATAPYVQPIIYVDFVDGSGVSVPSVVQDAQANTNQGLLEWKTSWTGNSISLIVLPGEAKAQTYSTSIIWTLNDVPPAL